VVEICLTNNEGELYLNMNIWTKVHEGEFYYLFSLITFFTLRVLQFDNFDLSLSQNKKLSSFSFLKFQSILTWLMHVSFYPMWTNRVNNKNNLWNTNSTTNKLLNSSQNTKIPPQFAISLWLHRLSMQRCCDVGSMREWILSRHMKVHWNPHISLWVTKKKEI
jgi:hypothetical protein